MTSSAIVSKLGAMNSWSRKSSRAISWIAKSPARKIGCATVSPDGANATCAGSPSSAICVKTAANTNDRPALPYPNYFTPPFSIDTTSTGWTYANRTFVMPAGFPNADVSVLLPDVQSTKELAHEKHTKAPEGALAGAATGGVLGGTLGLLVGLGVLAIPGLGPFIAAGPIMATLAGAGVGGAVGTLTGALVGLGIPEYEAKRYESYLNKGGALLAVHADDNDWAKKAKTVLDRCGATDIDKTSEASGSSK